MSCSGLVISPLNLWLQVHILTHSCGAEWLGSIQQPQPLTQDWIIHVFNGFTMSSLVRYSNIHLVVKIRAWNRRTFYSIWDPASNQGSSLPIGWRSLTASPFAVQPLRDTVLLEFRRINSDGSPNALAPWLGFGRGVFSRHFKALFRPDAQIFDVPSFNLGRMEDEGMMHLATLTMLNPDVLFSTVERILPAPWALNTFWSLDVWVNIPSLTQWKESDLLNQAFNQISPLYLG